VHAAARVDGLDTADRSSHAMQTGSGKTYSIAGDQAPRPSPRPAAPQTCARSPGYSRMTQEGVERRLDAAMRSRAPHPHFAGACCNSSHFRRVLGPCNAALGRPAVGVVHLPPNANAVQNAIALSGTYGNNPTDGIVGRACSALFEMVDTLVCAGSEVGRCAGGVAAQCGSRVCIHEEHSPPVHVRACSKSVVDTCNRRSTDCPSADVRCGQIECAGVFCRDLKHAAGERGGVFRRDLQRADV
jgi:hypothetical protein